MVNKLNTNPGEAKLVKYEAVWLQQTWQRASFKPKQMPGLTCAGVAKLLVGNDDGMLGQQRHMVHVC